jgi:hypothetical protein
MAEALDVDPLKRVLAKKWPRVEREAVRVVREEFKLTVAPSRSRRVMES